METLPLSGPRAGAPGDSISLVESFLNGVSHLPQILQFELPFLNCRHWRLVLAAEAEKEFIDLNMSGSQNSCESLRQTSHE